MMLSFQRDSRIAWPGCTRVVVRFDQDYEQSVVDETIMFDNLPSDTVSGLLQDRCTLQIYEGEELKEVRGMHRRVKR